MFGFPSKSQLREQWYTALGANLYPETKKKIDLNPHNHKLAAWHFDRRHLEEDQSGHLHFRKQETYQDNDRKLWHTPHRPPPNNALDSYKQQVEALYFPGLRDRWTSESEATLPAWISTMRRSEKNADNPIPAKRNKVTPSPMIAKLWNVP
jgi:hypothetical protein